MTKRPDIDERRADRDAPGDGRVPSADPKSRWLSRVTEPRLLYPIIAIVALAAIWGATWSLIRDERAAAEHTAVLSTHQLAETYEARMLRSLREIDGTLKVVKYAYEFDRGPDLLRELKARGLLPPPLLFEVSTVNSKGDVLASTRPVAMINVADWDVFQSQRVAGVFSVGRPRRDPASAALKLDFSRRIDGPDGSFAGIALLSVDAAYFVSSYESAQLGQQGMLGLIGSDGVDRVRRSGNTVSAGGWADIVPMVTYANDFGDESTSEAAILTDPWDGVRRYTMAKELYGYPLAVIVGLSVDEQMAGVLGNRRDYLWRASAASLLLVLLVAVFGRMSWQLALSRKRTVVEHIENAARAEALAYHDSLTTLPNRSLFSKLLGQSIRQAYRYNRHLAVLFFDLDHFKQVNDTRGHEAGDQLLQEIATRLKACLRASDTIARMGGDEFVALLPELQEEKYVVTVARKILTAVARPFTVNGQEIRVTASIGISIYPQDGLDEQTLERNADTAMYQVKEKGKNNFQFYSEVLNASSLEPLSL
jgi:diguanylate cyclase (GGDEF)-like protein